MVIRRVVFTPGTIVLFFGKGVALWVEKRCGLLVGETTGDIGAAEPAGNHALLAGDLHGREKALDTAQKELSCTVHVLSGVPLVPQGSIAVGIRGNAHTGIEAGHLLVVGNDLEYRLSGPGFEVPSIRGPEEVLNQLSVRNISQGNHHVGIDAVARGIEDQVLPVIPVRLLFQVRIIACLAGSWKEPGGVVHGLCAVFITIVLCVCTCCEQCRDGYQENQQETRQWGFCVVHEKPHERMGLRIVHL